MAKINPEILKELRKRLGYSLEDVQARSGINKSTIHRLEGDKTGSTRRNVIDKIAQALNTTPEILTGENAEDLEDSPLFERSRLNVSLPHQIRNALHLVASRYSVSALDILEVAPLLFYLAAEESLKEREAKLAALRAARDGVEALRTTFPHITERLVRDWDVEDLEQQEQKSISLRDIRGTILDEYAGGPDPRPSDYEADAHNPLVTHLRKRLTALGHGDEFEFWHEALSPQYLICREQVLSYCGEDESAADDIQYGAVALHDIPEDLRPFEQLEKRNAWIAERRRGRLESLGDFFSPVLPGAGS